AFPAELRRRSLAEEHRTLFPHARYRSAVFLPWLIRIYGAGPAARGPAFGEDQIFHGSWHAIDQSERRALLPSRLGLARPAQGGFRVDHDEGIVDWLQFLDPRERGLDCFDGRQSLRPILLDQCVSG